MATSCAAHQRIAVLVAEHRSHRRPVLVVLVDDQDRRQHPEREADDGRCRASGRSPGQHTRPRRGRRTATRDDVEPSGDVRGHQAPAVHDQRQPAGGDHAPHRHAHPEARVAGERHDEAPTRLPGSTRRSWQPAIPAGTHLPSIGTLRRLTSRTSPPELRSGTRKCADVRAFRVPERGWCRGGRTSPRTWKAR